MVNWGSSNPIFTKQLRTLGEASSVSVQHEPKTISAGDFHACLLATQIAIHNSL
jgi:hypothetical protein